jgi:hypothetical protein
LKLVFINKSHDEKRTDSKDFAIVNILKSMAESVALESGNKVTLIVSPGYLSTKRKAACKLYSYIFNNADIKYKIGMLNGYMSKPEYLNYFNNFCRRKGFPYPIEFSPQGDLFFGMNGKVTSNDHRKMIFICEPVIGVKSGKKYKRKILRECFFCAFSGIDRLERKDIDSFVDDLNICGVLIGSSNFSYSTYMGGKDGRADKGEADVLMYRNPSDCVLNKSFDSLLEGNISAYDIKQKSPEERPRYPEIPEGYEEINRMISDSLGNILISEVKGGLGKKTDLDFFRDILRDTLKSQVK